MKLLQTIRRPFRYSFFNVTLILIVLNLAVYLLSEFFPIIRVYLGMNTALVSSGFVWQPFTYMFVHASVGHIFFNMLALFFFGTQIERATGSWEFLLYYLLTGLLAGIFSLIFYGMLGERQISLIGASGAVYAVLFGFAALYPDARILVFGIFPVRSVILVMVYTGIELFSQLSGSMGVAHLTHLSGFLFAYLYFLIRFGRNPIREWFFPHGPRQI